MTAPAEPHAEPPAEPRRETPQEYVRRQREEIVAGRLSVRTVILECNRQLSDPATAQRAIAALLLPLIREGRL